MTLAENPVFKESCSHLPDLLKDHLAAQLDKVADSVKWPENHQIIASIPSVLSCSDFVVRVLNRFGDQFDESFLDSLLSVYLPGQHMSTLKQRCPAESDEAHVARELRRYRQVAMMIIAWRDLAGWAALDETFNSLTELAQASVRIALQFSQRWQQVRFGVPRDAEGNEQQMMIIGMGKLGGGELNYSSDIDLIFFFPEKGETDGKRSVSNDEYFTQVGRKVIRLLDELTEDGFVFRVDMRLRPFGKSGPLVMCLDAAEHYYQAQGRTWERYAMIKAAVIAGEASGAQQFYEMISPFVYRRYLDYGSLESLRDMKRMIVREIGAHGNETNIKIGFGGIREIEFIGQAFQLTRGGKVKSLQIRPIQQVLRNLHELEFLAGETVDSLLESYEFLRRVENRVQAMNDEQTHQLPATDLGKQRLAFSMGFDSWDSFLEKLGNYRNLVHAQFVETISLEEESGGQAGNDSVYQQVWSLGDVDAVDPLLEKINLVPGNEVREAIGFLRQSTGYRLLNDSGRSRLDRLVPQIMTLLEEYDRPGQILMRLFRLLQKVMSRSCYVALLVENPQALKQLIKLCAASPWIAEYLSQQPVLFDDLLNPVMLYAPLRYEGLKQELDKRMNDIDEDDLERQMEELRRFTNTHRLRVAAADISGAILVMRVSDCLTEMAEVVLQKVLELAWNDLVAKHGRPTAVIDGKKVYPEFGVVAYGKLGGIELGYGSDLDLVFLHEAGGRNQQTEGPKSIENQVFFTRLGKKIIHFLSTRTPAGILYEIDMRLRPSGNSGLLVVDLGSFEKYQLEKAWTWEHQAIVRARPVAGSPHVAGAFEEVRNKAVNLKRDPDTLLQEIIDMRDRMRQELDKSNDDIFDLKQGRGGITDIEFMVQYLVLRWSEQTPWLVQYTDNIHLIEELTRAGRLSNDDAQYMKDAYRAYRDRGHKLALQQEPSLVSSAEFMEYRKTISGVWDRVMLPGYTP